VLLERIPEVKLMAYSLETVVAEKFHAMIDRDETNSRMKDFFDVYQIF
jgi:predicted nucleotidyltransferase component of viral defense system